MGFIRLTVEGKKTSPRDEKERELYPMKDKPKTRDAELCRPWAHRLLTWGGGSGLPAILRRGVQVSLGRAVLQREAGVDGVVVHGVAVQGHQQALPGAWGKGRWDSSSGFPHRPPLLCPARWAHWTLQSRGEAEHCGQ